MTDRAESDSDRERPNCDGGAVLYEALTPRLDTRDPAFQVREWPCPGCPNCEDPMTREPPPMRGWLTPEVETAARAIHRDVWGESYRALRGPMHYAGGPYWRNELLRRADRWEALAAAARTCAEVLPDA